LIPVAHAGASQLSNMMVHGIMSQPLPVRSKGSGALADTSLEPFSDPVMAHIIKADKQCLAAQSGKELVDEKAILTYMASDASDAMSKPIDNDLSYPLSCYFISSSHNTYLSGHQLYGEASTEAYTSVLRRGCRCLEIDVWDGETDSDASDSSEPEEKSESRWGKVKARAARIRSRSHSGGSDTNGARLATSPSAPSTLRKPDGSKDQLATTPPIGTGSFPYDTNHLSPHPSPSLPFKAEPRVLHGYTLTQSITFRSVCHAIKDSAFVSTDLPLIVSLEVHASLSQQLIMVEIMREVWSEYLVSLDDGTQISALPPPESLRRKILIKVKWAPKSDSGTSNDPIEHVNSNTSNESVPASPEKKKKASKVLSALSELGIYTRAYHFKNFDQPEAKIPNHVFSLSESKVHDMHLDADLGPALYKHNKSYLTRVFPKGTRINSSNVEPTLHWRMGAQMVALNWQRIDQGMMLNHAMFADTGGWAIKPASYRCEKSDTMPAKVEPTHKRLELAVRLLAGQRIPLPPEKEISHSAKIRVYVKAELHPDSIHSTDSSQLNGGPSDENDAQHDDSEDKKSKIYKRKSATYRSDCPDFGGEALRWSDVPDVVQSLSFLR
jgi:hypothetical protein